MLEEDARWKKLGEELRENALEFLNALELDEVGAEEQALQDRINDKCTAYHLWVEQQIGALLKKGKKAILLGGDHSTSLGAIRAHKAAFGDFGILQIDAHADLRPAYEGFTYSHASIMYNVLKEKMASSLTIVGLRDYCHQEAELIASDERIHAFTDKDMKAAQFEGKTWSNICGDIVATLPQQVYLSFDIDGLDPALCPNTGTPVPGGMKLEEVLYLVDAVLASGRTLIGFDLVEVGPGEDEWDANVGARALYSLSNRLS
jgi:agmatinase